MLPVLASGPLKFACKDRLDERNRVLRKCSTKYASAGSTDR